MRALFCTDGSKISYNSIKNFVNWFPDAIVDIFCAIDWSFLPDNVSVDDSDFATKCTNSADSILNYSENLLLESDIQVGEKIKMCGSTVDSIMEICSKSDYDYIVLGSHGKKGIQKWLGSVSQEIATSSKISTYISKESNDAHKLLFALDSSDVSKNVVEHCISQLNMYKKEIHLVTVYEAPDYLFLEGNIDENWSMEVDRKQETEARFLLNEFEKRFNDNNISIKSKAILKGYTSVEIIKYIDEEDIDLTVCGVRDRKYLAKFLLNSVSKRVLEDAKSDVLIVRPNNFQS